MGAPPDWYGLIQSAKYLGVAPWVLLEQPVIWREWAYLANKAETEAEKQREARQNRKNKVK